MDKQTPPPQKQSLWQKLHTTLIMWGILAPPGSKEASISAEEQAIRKRVFFWFRRHPGGR